MFKRLFAAGLVFGAAALAPPLEAQTRSCALRDTLVASLEARFDERRVAVGLQSPTQLLEILAAPETGTWTALLTDPNGVSCIVASGTHWHLVPDAPPMVSDERG